MYGKNDGAWKSACCADRTRRREQSFLYGYRLMKRLQYQGRILLRILKPNARSYV